MIYLPMLQSDERHFAEAAALKARYLADAAPLTKQIYEAQRALAKLNYDLSRALAQLYHDRQLEIARFREDIRKQARERGDKSLLRIGDWVRVPLTGADGQPFTAQMQITERDSQTVWGSIGAHALHFPIDQVEWIDAEEVYPS